MGVSRIYGKSLSLKGILIHWITCRVYRIGVHIPTPGIDRKVLQGYL
jgi:preprotein translocase subunit SecY